MRLVFKNNLGFVGDRRSFEQLRYFQSKNPARRGRWSRAGVHCLLQPSWNPAPTYSLNRINPRYLPKFKATLTMTGWVSASFCDCSWRSRDPFGYCWHHLCIDHLTFTQVQIVTDGIHAAAYLLYHYARSDEEAPAQLKEALKAVSRLLKDAVTFWLFSAQLSIVPLKGELKGYQKTSYKRRASEATCGLALKHWVQLSYSWFTLQRSTANQFDIAAHTPVSSTVFWMTPCALSLDACVIRQRTNCQSF